MWRFHDIDDRCRTPTVHYSGSRVSMPETPVLRTLAFECIIQCVRLMSRLTWLVGLLCASAPVLFQQDRLPASDPDRDNDARAIYSWLITHSADQDKLYLIAPETSQSDYPRDRCLEVPPDHINVDRV